MSKCEFQTAFQLERTLEDKIKWMLSPGILIDLRSDLDQFIDLVEGMPVSDRDDALTKAYQQMHLRWFSILDREPEIETNEPDWNVRVWEEWDATLLYLKSSWTEEKSPMAIKQIKEFIKDSLVNEPPMNLAGVARLETDDIWNMLKLLDVKYDFVRKFLNDEDSILDIALIEEEIHQESFYHSYLDEDGFLNDIIGIGRVKAEKKDYLQHMLLYNLGHAVHTRMTRKTSLPPSFMELLKKMYDYDDRQLPEIAARLFAQTFALTAAKNTLFEKSSPYHLLNNTAENRLCQYMEALLDAYQGSGMPITLKELERFSVIKKEKPLS